MPPDPFWTAVGAAGLAGVASGLVLVRYQHRLDQKARRNAYEAVRSQLVTDLLHNLDILVQLWAQAKAPYHFIPETADQMPYILGDKRLVVNGGRSLKFHIETWELAAPQLLAMSTSPGDGLRFARAFQIIRDCMAYPLEGLGESDTLRVMRRWSYQSRNTIFQPSVVLTLDGKGMHQIHSVPASVHRVTYSGDGKEEIVSLIIEYGAESQADRAREIGEKDWAACVDPTNPSLTKSSWRGIDGGNSWLPTVWIPKEAGGRIDA